MEEKLYTTAEIMLATGLGRGTITNRAAKLGFKRTGQGYTEKQVLTMVTMPMMVHRKSEANAVELRQRLNAMIEKAGYPMRIVSDKDGNWSIKHWEVYDDDPEIEAGEDGRDMAAGG